MSEDLWFWLELFSSSVSRFFRLDRLGIISIRLTTGVESEDFAVGC